MQNEVSYSSTMPNELKMELCSSHAGEMGAVFIYIGILSASWDPHVRAFAREHLRTEYQHLCLFEELIHLYRGSLVLPLWVMAGFLTGFLPALLGRDWVFRTIETVETFVEAHYQSQINRFEDFLNWTHLIPMLSQCREDEMAHRDDAGARVREPASRLCQIWLAMVARGSAVAVSIAKRI